jgi:hypothetical protein
MEPRKVDMEIGKKGVRTDTKHGHGHGFMGVNDASDRISRRFKGNPKRSS